MSVLHKDDFNAPEEPPKVTVRGHEVTEYDAEYVDLTPIEITVERPWFLWFTRERTITLEVDATEMDVVPIDPETGQFHLGDKAPLGCTVEVEYGLRWDDAR